MEKVKFYCWNCNTEIKIKNKTLMKCPNCSSYKVIPRKMKFRKCNPKHCDAGKSSFFHGNRPKGFPKEKGDCAHLIIRGKKKYCAD
jgi:predicted RNA-binding Zn-ribbon protein involved in translation (DUF1610 family)